MSLLPHFKSNIRSLSEIRVGRIILLLILVPMTLAKGYLLKCVCLWRQLHGEFFRLCYRNGACNEKYHLKKHWQSIWAQLPSLHNPETKFFFLEKGKVFGVDCVSHINDITVNPWLFRPQMEIKYSKKKKKKERKKERKTRTLTNSQER